MRKDQISKEAGYIKQAMHFLELAEKEQGEMREFCFKAAMARMDGAFLWAWGRNNPA